jgi:flavin-dependent dehydrogenase
MIGVADRIDRAGFIRSAGNTVWWGGEARVEPFADGARGWQVTAGALAAVLLDAASDAGATLEAMRLDAAAVASADAQVVLDCTGRSGLIARSRGWRQYEPGQRTVALVGLWQRRGWPIPDDTHTLIESYQDGWLWSVPIASDTRSVAAMVDPRSSALEGSEARAIYLAEIAKAPHLAALVADARLTGGPWGFDASMYDSSRYAGPDALLVGDAGSFIDPLSSAGVKKALASAWLAAVAAHTSIRNPAMRDEAFAFFNAREDEIYREFRALTRRFFGDAAANHPHPFWTDRAGPLDARAANGMAGEEKVRAAFERIRTAPRLALARAPHISVAPRAAVSGCEIVMEPRLVWDADSGIRYLSDVDLITLTELAPQHHDAGALFEAYTRRSAPVALPDFLHALAASVANGWLVWRV